MIHLLTGWDLTLSEGAICPHCHDPAAHLVIADLGTLDETRAAVEADLNTKTKKDLASLCSARQLTSAGTRGELVKRLVAQTVADVDPNSSYEQYHQHLLYESSNSDLPLTYQLYRQNFNSVDTFNRRVYSLSFPRTQSEEMHMFIGQIHIALVNTASIRGARGTEEELQNLAHDIGRALLGL